MSDQKPTPRPPNRRPNKRPLDIYKARRHINWAPARLSATPMVGKDGPPIAQGKRLFVWGGGLPSPVPAGTSTPPSMHKHLLQAGTEVWGGGSQGCHYQRRIASHPTPLSHTKELDHRMCPLGIRFPEFPFGFKKSKNE